MSGGMTAGMCPTRVEGTTIVASDVDGGVGLVFTTQTGDVGELRKRVRRMAEMHDRMGAMHERQGGAMKGAPSGTETGDGTMKGGSMMGGGSQMPAATASVEDVEGGARLILRPHDPQNLEALRKHSSERTERMRRGQCPMMGARGAAEPEAHPAGGE